MLSLMLHRRVTFTWMLAIVCGLSLPLPGAGIARAQGNAASEEQGLKEIEVAANAFVRGAPLPAWADLLPLPATANTVKAPLVVRLADSHVRVGSPHLYVVNRAEQALEASALSQIGQPQIPFNPQFQRLLVHKLIIVRGDQMIDHTATAKLRFLQRESGLEQGVYSGVVTATMVLPDVRVGDTLHMIYTLEGENPIFGSRYIGSSSWEQVQPVQLRRVSVWTPAGREVRWKWVGDRIQGAPQPRREEVGDMQRLRFEQKDVPGVDIEPLLPAGAQPWRWLQFSEYRSWSEVAQWAQPLFPLDAPLPSELAAQVKGWLLLPTEEQRAAEALYWVQNEIRYYSLALGESSHRPALPAEVLQRRWGDCKDKSLMLVRLLSEMKIPAVPVLAAQAGRSGPMHLLPSPAAFDHAIVRVRLNGSDFFLDPTRLGQAGPLELGGQALEEASVLAIEPTAHDLVTVKSRNRDRLFASQLVERLRLDKFGEPGSLTIEQTWSGIAAEGLRQAMPQMADEQLRKWVLGGYDRRYPGITVEGQPRLRDDVAQNRVVLTAEFRVPELGSELAGDWVVRFFPSNFQGSFALPDRMTRQFPVGVPAWPGTMNYRVEVTWPSSVSVVADPRNQRLDASHFRSEASRSFRGNVASASMSLQPIVGQIPAAELPRLMDDLRKLDQQVGGAFFVAKSQIKSEGILGLGRTTMQDAMRKRAQTQVERTTAAISSGRLSGDDLAEALCSRAEALADLERAAEGLPDAQRATKEVPHLGRSFGCRGALHYAMGDFSAAVADFSRALGLNDDNFSNLYKRGQARFYLGQYAQAAADFARAAADKSDQADRLFAQLWQAWSLLRAQQAWPEDLTQAAKAKPRGDWPRPALAMLAGVLSPEQVLARIDETMKGDQRELTLAEAWFYIGQHHLAGGRREPARAAFEKARSFGVTMYVEHVAAGFELQRMAGNP